METAVVRGGQPTVPAFFRPRTSASDDHELALPTHQRHPLSRTGRDEAIALRPPKAFEGSPAARIGNIKYTIFQNVRKAPCVVLTQL